MEKKLKDIFECKRIEDDGELYSLQIWYNHLIEKTISELSVADVLRMIRQNMFMEIAISKAICFLKVNPLEGELYEGELLKKISEVDNVYIKDYFGDINDILSCALTENEVYDWLIDEDRIEFKKVIELFSERLKKLADAV